MFLIPESGAGAAEQSLQPDASSPWPGPLPGEQEHLPQLISTPLSIMVIIKIHITIIIITLKGSGSEELEECITTQEK